MSQPAFLQRYYIRHGFESARPLHGKIIASPRIEPGVGGFAGRHANHPTLGKWVVRSVAAMLVSATCSVNCRHGPGKDGNWQPRTHSDQTLHLVVTSRALSSEN